MEYQVTELRTVHSDRMQVQVTYLEYLLPRILLGLGRSWRLGPGLEENAQFVVCVLDLLLLAHLLLELGQPPPGDLPLHGLPACAADSLGSLPSGSPAADDQLLFQFFC